MQRLAHCRKPSVGTSQPVSGIKRAHWIGYFLRLKHNLNPALEWFHFIVFFFFLTALFFISIKCNSGNWEKPGRLSSVRTKKCSGGFLAQIKILSLECLSPVIGYLLTWLECVLLLCQTFDRPKGFWLHVTTEQVELQDYSTCQMLSDFLQMQGVLRGYWTQHCKYRMYKKVPKYKSQPWALCKGRNSAMQPSMI